MNETRDRIEANIDYGTIVGFFVRVDVEFPRAALYPTPSASDLLSANLRLSPDEAEALADQLVIMARRVREEQDRRSGRTDG